MAAKSLRESFSLVASVASFIASIVIPLTRFVLTPTPFSATIHYEALEVPSPISKAWTLPKAANARDNRVAKSERPSFDPPQEVLIVTVANNGKSARHNVNMTVDGLLVFAGSELSPLTTSTIGATCWRTPDFRQDSSELLFPSIAALPGETGFQVFIWGHYRFFGPQIELRSDEGLGVADAQGAVSGWPLFIALNAWWISMLISVAGGVWFLRRFLAQERERKC
jgi:hypothetical protein